MGQVIEFASGECGNERGQSDRVAVRTGPLALPREEAMPSTTFIERHIGQMKIERDTSIRCQPSVRSTTVTLDVQTSWPHASWMRGRVSVRLTLADTSTIEADIFGSEAYLHGVQRLSIIFPQQIRRNEIVHIELVLPTSPTTNFTHLLL